MSKTISIEELEKTWQSFDDPNDFVEWARKNLEHIGLGSTREVFKLNEDMVLKLARPKYLSDGRSSNFTEYKMYRCLTSKYASKILHIQDEGRWLISERVLHLKNGEEFINKLEESMNLKLDKNPFDEKISSPNNIKLYNQSEWFKGLIDKIRHCKLFYDDFYYVNWGIRKETGELVLLDYGFEEDREDFLNEIRLLDLLFKM